MSVMRRVPVTLLLVGLAVTACSERSTSTAPDRTVAESTAGGLAASSTPTSSTSCLDPSAPTTVVYAVRRGVAPEETSLDVHVPSTATCDAPVVVWVHGGGYRGGDKGNQMADKVRLFGESGWILVSTNYRLTPDGREGSPEFTDPFDDVAAAVSWVHDHIAEYGGDPSRIALLGHSAGADIVANLATDPTYLGALGLSLADLRCAGPLDTVGFADVEVRAGLGIPPIIGVVRGTAERRRIETEFLDRLDAVGVETTMIDARSLSHEEVNGNIGAADDSVMTDPLMDFLSGCFESP